MKAVKNVSTEAWTEVKCARCGVVIKHTWEKPPFSPIEKGRQAEAQEAHDLAAHGAD